ncbi:hypothetical protein QR680_017839 [Steinernema hermaphroditum]|uniref:Uncharacterized protein n=1 Tax=Steinernema hermaphroditum TaxID=289476 RepID=A0AA39HG03_9BILA|nr:hypothetical protein QR680_017839 [Steinernema hermaphroditum]
MFVSGVPAHAAGGDCLENPLLKDGVLAMDQSTWKKIEEGAGDSRTYVTYTKDELMELNPQRNNPFWRPADVTFSHGFGDFGDVDPISMDDSPRSRRSRRSRRSNLRPVNVVDLLSQPVEAPPKPPISESSIPLLPTALYENVLKFGTQGDGYDVFRSPLPADLFCVRSELNRPESKAKSPTAASSDL